MRANAAYRPFCKRAGNFANFQGLTDVVFLCDYGNDNMMQHIGMLVTLWGVAVLLIWGWRELGPGERVKSGQID
jgi:hypothetical protein